MSVILDALAKARGDKRSQQPEPQPNSVARVLDSGTAPADFAAGAVAPRRRSWLAGIAVVFGLLCLLALIGGGFFLLYDQVRRLESRAVLQETATVESPAKSQALLDTIPADIAPLPTLPTPVPEAELPVQVPNSGAGTAPAGSDNVYAPAAATTANTAALPVDFPGTVAAPPAASAGAASGEAAISGVAGTATEPGKAAQPQFKLGSIVCEEAICVASLNGRTVRVGDEIRGYQVNQITETGITLKSLSSSDTIALSLFD